jgi:hypothetical protein
MPLLDLSKMDSVLEILSTKGGSTFIHHLTMVLKCQSVAWDLSRLEIQQLDSIHPSLTEVT